VRGRAIAEVEHNLVHVTPAPALGRVISLDDQAARLLKVLGGVSVRGVVATADMAGGSAQAQVDPWRAGLQHSSQPSALGVTSRMPSRCAQSSFMVASEVEKRCARHGPPGLPARPADLGSGRLTEIL
jgi:hypothetical protein